MRQRVMASVLTAAVVAAWIGTAQGVVICTKARAQAWGKYQLCVEKILVPALRERLEVERRVPPYDFAATDQVEFVRRRPVRQRQVHKDNAAGIHDKDDVYTWGTGAPYKENGTTFTGFLGTVNSAGGFGGANGWRLPTMAELQTIVLGDVVSVRAL